MAQGPRIVAELGRPETPAETAARKAESSRVYRSSQSFRNLIAALIITVAIVVVIVLIVPRGQPAPRDPIDVAAVAAEVEAAEGRPVVSPALDAEWIVNLAQLGESGGLRTWTVVFAQDEKYGTGFIRVEQGFAADPAWPTRVLSGAGAGDTVTIDGIVWDRYDITDPSRSGNVATALSTAAGPDTVMIYGTADDASFELAAASVSDDIRSAREEAE